METSPSKAIGDDIQALQQVLAIMAPLNDEQRRRVFSSISTFFNLSQNVPPQSAGSRLADPSFSPKITSAPNYGKFSEHTEIGPKEFMLQKEPKTDIERVACLAYYLTHYRSTPHFKTLDISKLNAEAAQLKFSNAAMAVDNASKRGFLVSSAKGNKQLSAIGEMYIRELPDREAASEVLQKHGPRRSKARRTSTESGSEQPESADALRIDAT